MLLKISILLVLLQLTYFNALLAQYTFKMYYTEAEETAKAWNLVKPPTIVFTPYVKGKTKFYSGKSYLIKLIIDGQNPVGNTVLLANTVISSIECFVYTKSDSFIYSRAGYETNFENQFIQSGDKNKVYINATSPDNVI